MTICSCLFDIVNIIILGKLQLLSCDSDAITSLSWETVLLLLSQENSDTLGFLVFLYLTLAECRQIYNVYGQQDFIHCF